MLAVKSSRVQLRPTLAARKRRSIFAGCLSAVLLAAGGVVPVSGGIDTEDTTAAVLYARPQKPKPGTDTPPPAAPPPEAPLPPLEAKPRNEAIAVSFRHLDFRPPNELDLGIVPETRFLEKAPAHIRALDGRLVRITGYMMPVRMEKDKVVECIVVPSLLHCCFGKVPRFCEYVVARMKGEPIPKLLDRPVIFHGKLSVGDVFEQGYWVTFYTLDCTRIDP